MNLDGLRYLVLLAAGEQQSAPMWVGLTPFLLIFVIMYLLILRPQKRKEDERQKLLNAVKKNDRVVTIGGIHGKVVTIRDDEVVLKLDKKGDLRVTFNKSAISRILTEHEEDQGEGESLKETLRSDDGQC